MAYLSEAQLNTMGFKKIGVNVKISDRASIYNPELIEIGDNSRIDDYCVVSGVVVIGRNVHIAPFCLVAGGEKGIFIEDFSGLAYRVTVFSQSDDYSGEYMTNPTIPKEYKNETKREVIICRHSIVGVCSVIMPGVKLSEGTSIGASSLVRKSTEAWSVYVGNPAKKIKNRKKALLELESKFLGGQRQ